MAAKIGHAVANELSTATGGKPGNQNGKELRFQSYYAHAKGWNLIRAKDPKVAAMLAKAVTDAVNNPNIGYCQTTRSGLQNELAKIGYSSISEVKVPCNTDCSALVRACCWVAGVRAPAFNTDNELKMLLATSAFDHIKEPWSEKDLRAGDILVTKTKGHTAIVVFSESTGTPTTPTAPGQFVFTQLLKSGSKGVAVMELKRLLIAKGYTEGITVTNQNFAANTDAVVRVFQRANGLVVDGIAGKNTITALGGVWKG